MFEERATSPDTQRAAHQGEQPLPDVSILLVDDHRPSLLALAATLEPLGYRLVTADSAAAALRLLATQHFVAILSDLRMPGMDGFEMLARLRQTGLARETAVILFSAAGHDRDSARRAFELGAVDFISKPYDPDLLRWRVRALVSLCRPRPAAVGDAGSSAALAVAEEAERLLRNKDRFVAVLGHDLRTPLSAMLVGCRILGADPGLTDRHRTTLARLGRAVDRMSRMVRDIVDFARTATGTSFPIRPRPTNVAELLSSVIDEIRGAHPDRPIDLSIPDELLGSCDPDRIAQAVENLVVNAIAHGEGGVRISAGARSDEIVVKVRNDGPPIPPDSIAGLFDPFVHPAEHSSGLGLGLYIVNEIVRGHGGTVDVHSSAGQGTTFELRWPRWLADERLGVPTAGPVRG